MGVSKSETYASGFQDALKLYGSCCTGHNNCEECPVNYEVGSSTCEEFMRDNPSQFAQILTRCASKGLSYYNVYCMRFPASSVPVEELSTACCRRVMFEGYCDCPGGDCKACWEEDADETV